MYKCFFKRLFDIIGAIILLPFVLLVVIIFAPIIYFTDKGPIFYNAPRVGKHFKIFKMYKLRSMYVNAPDIRNSDGSTYNAADDPRVTPIGRFMRKTSIDEFPQFLNVLIGDMSFIGPRPILPRNEYTELQEYLKEMMTVRPGITGYNQANYRNSIARIDKYKNDAFYATHLTFLMDVIILFKTIATVLFQKNINTNSNGGK